MSVVIDGLPCCSRCVEREIALADCEERFARIRRIALDLEIDHRSGKLRRSSSDGFHTARRLRAAIGDSP